MNSMETKQELAVEIMSRHMERLEWKKIEAWSQPILVELNEMYSLLQTNETKNVDFNEFCKFMYYEWGFRSNLS